jgi:hypothetical protein
LVDATLLLLAMVLGAIVVLVVQRFSQAESQSMRHYSEAMLQRAAEMLSSAEKQAARDRTTAELATQVEKLDATVGNLFLMVRSNRTVLEKPLQVGEAPPGSPGVLRTRTQQELPPEGLTDSDPGASPARKPVFAVPT